MHEPAEQLIPGSPKGMLSSTEIEALRDHFKKSAVEIEQLLALEESRDDVSKPDEV